MTVRRRVKKVGSKFQGSPSEAHEERPKPVYYTLWPWGLRGGVGFLSKSNPISFGWDIPWVTRECSQAVPSRHGEDLIFFFEFNPKLFRKIGFSSNFRKFSLNPLWCSENTPVERRTQKVGSVFKHSHSLWPWLLRGGDVFLSKKLTIFSLMTYLGPEGVLLWIGPQPHEALICFCNLFQNHAKKKDFFLEF